MNPLQADSNMWYFCETLGALLLVWAAGVAAAPADGIIINQPCENFTEGQHCERCISGYFGTPVNGGKCTPCQCNNQGTCHPETGMCLCTTKGIIGDHCEKCDTEKHYTGDPEKESCFYEVTTDYQYTFNLSKKEDGQYSQLNLKNVPPKPDINAEFGIQSSVPSKMNITFRTNGGTEKNLVIAYNLTSTLFRHNFLKSDFQFGTEDNTTFYVYVYDFIPPLWIQISFSQYVKNNPFFE